MFIVGFRPVLRGLYALTAATRKVLFFMPYNRVLQPAPGSPDPVVWNECKRRVALLAADVPNTLAVDFIRSRPITDADDNDWDALHYRVGVAERLANDLAAADRGETSPDYQVLSLSPSLRGGEADEASSIKLCAHHSREIASLRSQ